MHTREEMSLVPHFLLRTEKGERRQRPSRRSWLSRLSRRRRRVPRLSCRRPLLGAVPRSSPSIDAGSMLVALVPSPRSSWGCFDRRCPRRRRRWAKPRLGVARGFARRGAAPTGRAAGATKVEPPRSKGSHRTGWQMQQAEKPNFR